MVDQDQVMGSLFFVSDLASGLYKACTFTELPWNKRM